MKINKRNFVTYFYQYMLKVNALYQGFLAGLYIPKAFSIHWGLTHIEWISQYTPLAKAVISESYRGAAEKRFTLTHLRSLYGSQEQQTRTSRFIRITPGYDDWSVFVCELSAVKVVTSLKSNICL